MDIPSNDNNVIPLFPKSGEGKNTNIDPRPVAEKVTDLIGPQSEENNLTKTLEKGKIDKLLTNLQTWLTRTKSSNINPYEFMTEFLVPMAIIQEIEVYSKEKISKLGFQERYDTIIPATIIYLGKMIGIPEGKDVREELNRLYIKLKTPIEEGKIGDKKEAK